MRMKVLGAAALACAVVASGPAAADHHLVERSLQAIRCIPASVREVARTGTTSAYAVACSGGTRRNVTLVCTTRGCLADEHSRHADAEEDIE